MSTKCFLVVFAMATATTLEQNQLVEADVMTIEGGALVFRGYDASPDHVLAITSDKWHVAREVGAEYTSWQATVARIQEDRLRAESLRPRPSFLERIRRAFRLARIQWREWRIQ